MQQRPSFIYLTCQVGAEKVLKNEVARKHPALKFAFSRPGILTFKLSEDHELVADFDPGLVFARSHGFSLGRVNGKDIGQLAEEVWSINAGRPIRHLHVWPRDRHLPGDHGFEPSITPETIKTYETIRQACPQPDMLAAKSSPHGGAKRGDFILDCILLENDEWLVGYHRAKGLLTRHPGAILPLNPPPAGEMISRAWLKMESSIRWAGFTIGPDSRCVEIGSAPGGATQALLQRGAHVIGIDPAAMDPRIVGHPRFVHQRRRASQVPHGVYRRVGWLMTDLNMPPSYTLQVVEDILLRQKVKVRGIILTLKFPEWHLTDQVDSYIKQVIDWGMKRVRAKQLAHHRREICLSARID